MTVNVEALELVERADILAVCVRGEHRQRLPLRYLPLPEPPPEGDEWIAAWRQWIRWMG